MEFGIDCDKVQKLEYAKFWLFCWWLYIVQNNFRYFYYTFCRGLVSSVSLNRKPQNHHITKYKRAIFIKTSLYPEPSDTTDFYFLKYTLKTLLSEKDFSIVRKINSAKMNNLMYFWCIFCWIGPLFPLILQRKV